MELDNDDDDYAGNVNIGENTRSIADNTSIAIIAVDVSQTSSIANVPSTISSPIASSSRATYLGGASQNENDFTNEASSSRSNLPPLRKWTRDHSFELIIGDAAAVSKQEEPPWMCACTVVFYHRKNLKRLKKPFLILIGF